MGGPISSLSQNVMPIRTTTRSGASSAIRTASGSATRKSSTHCARSAPPLPHVTPLTHGHSLVATSTIHVRPARSATSDRANRSFARTTTRSPNGGSSYFKTDTTLRRSGRPLETCDATRPAAQRPAPHTCRPDSDASSLTGRRTLSFRSLSVFRQYYSPSVTLLYF